MRDNEDAEAEQLFKQVKSIGNGNGKAYSTFQKGLPTHSVQNGNGTINQGQRGWKRFVFTSLLFGALTYVILDHTTNLFDDTNENNYDPEVMKALKEAWTVDSSPILSQASPDSIGYPSFSRYAGRPGEVYGKYLGQGALKTGRALPTNRWYQNLLMGGPKEEFGRVYTMPYIVDTDGPINGLRVHYPHIQASSSIVQMVFDAQYGLVVGTDDTRVKQRYELDEISKPSDLGVTLKWVDDSSQGTRLMTAPIVRGMPYVSVLYASGVAPVIQNTDTLVSDPIIDGKTSFKCDGTVMRVERDVLLHFDASDFTWLVFFSRPVDVECTFHEASPHTFVPGVVYASDQRIALKVKEDPHNSAPINVRVALANSCTRGHIPYYCNGSKPQDSEDFIQLLRDHSQAYPFTPVVKYAIPSKSDIETQVQDAVVAFNWDPHNIQDNSSTEKVVLEGSVQEKGKQIPRLSKGRLPEILMYALPHHRDIIMPSSTSSNEILGYCRPTLRGDACLVKGNEWLMSEDLGGRPSETAPRSPKSFALPFLVNTIFRDIKYTPDKNFMLGAGDTYFSGKQLAKLGRIIAITAELKRLKKMSSKDAADLDNGDGSLIDTVNTLKKLSLPSNEVFKEAVETLKQGVEIWFNGTAEAIFTYDDKYGGLISCGCDFDEGTRHCRNRFPNCPGYSNAGMNFGNGFYNDHHFHYGYHIYAAAIASSYDHKWGKKYFDHVLAYIRDIANPSSVDQFFPTFRHKDWYLGSSWASGVALIGNHPYPNGRNQESSSEAIAAYEAIGLYGQTMIRVFNGENADKNDYANAVTASRVRDLGRLLTATELRSAKTYWHSMDSDTPGRLYPSAYTPPSVGMLWSTMAQFQTWFGIAPFLPIGIQLLPITPVSERRDSLEWSKQIYEPFTESCSKDHMCIEQGWSILGYCLLAEIGHPELALAGALEVPQYAFESAGGNGHSLTNTLWYISTRPKVDDPLDLSEIGRRHHSGAQTINEKPKPGLPGIVPMPNHNNGQNNAVPGTSHGTNNLPGPITVPVVPVPVNKEVVDCGLPHTCTWQTLNADAEGAKCKDRMNWLMKNRGKSEKDACHQVAGIEYPTSCAGCDPLPEVHHNITNTTTPELPTNKTKLEPIAHEDYGECPICSQEVCRNDGCPPDGTWFLCTDGKSKSGCSASPWISSGANVTESDPCQVCCTLVPHCGDDTT